MLIYWRVTIYNHLSCYTWGCSSTSYTYVIHHSCRGCILTVIRTTGTVYGTVIERYSHAKKSYYNYIHVITGLYAEKAIERHIYNHIYISY
jgi:hypothetical protein